MRTANGIRCCATNRVTIGRKRPVFVPRPILRAAMRWTEPAVTTDEDRAIWQRARLHARLPNMLVGMAAHQERIRAGQRGAIRSCDQIDRRHRTVFEGWRLAFGRYLFQLPLRRLPRPQLGVEPALGQQLGMRPALGHPAGVEHDDLVGADHGRQAVGDDDGGAVARDIVEGRLDRFLGPAVERRWWPRRGSGSAGPSAGCGRWRRAASRRPRASARARRPSIHSPAAARR